MPPARASRHERAQAISTSRSTLGDAQPGDRLHVHALVGLEHLEGLERQRRRRAGAGTTLAQDAAERRHPAIAFIRLEHPAALDAAVELGPHPELIGEVELEPAGDPAGRHTGLEQLVGASQEQVERLGRVALLEAPVGELGEVPRRRRDSRESRSRSHARSTRPGHDVERPAAGEGEMELGEGLEAAPEPGRRSADALGDRLELAELGRDERQDAIGLAELEARQDDRIGGVQTTSWHEPTVSRRSERPVRGAIADRVRRAPGPRTGRRS